MRNNTILLACILSLTSLLNAQSNLSAVLEINYNTFSHKDLKSLQTEFQEDLSEVDLRINDDFNANIGYGIGLKIESLNTQFFGSYTTTGGKISYSDFSGIIRITQLLKSFTLGGEYQYELTDEKDRSRFYIGSRVFFNFTKFDLENYSRVNNNVTTDLIEFRSIDIGLGARAIYDIPISVVKLRINFGYDLVFGGAFKLSSNDELTLQNDEGDPIKPGWSGLRVGLGVVIPI
jgi:hypothetical protein